MFSLFNGWQETETGTETRRLSARTKAQTWLIASG
jgi:hypothetical protein